ncbi:hypothetical protein C4K68_12040 [Pokkaliibacter plantistimulans]|uniref:DUF1127 domain-containing protein n=1 Tax=Proteobacteria bacterium 228 TaxID=2083153 RepID=A0A2S5KQU7_9PROT|nr:hypothetical protein [Pokkaliibacter plantistimulans]PPC77138.1 hypothetical protein C4K68_12040 [Pokkaliibacter plantistimulans]
MNIVGLILVAYTKLRNKANNDLTFQQVKHLPPHLLKDIGLYRDGGAVRPLSGVSEQHEQKLTTATATEAKRGAIEAKGSSGEVLLQCQSRLKSAGD